VREDWYRFEQEAFNELRQLNDPPLVQVLSWPSFERPATWNIEAKSGRLDGRHFRYSYVEWHRYDDLAIFSDPRERLRYLNRLIRPRLTRRVVDQVPNDEVEPVLARISSLVVPMPRRGYDAIGLDGLRTEVAVALSTVSARYSWCNEAPATWEPLARIADDIRSLIRHSGLKLGWVSSAPPN
jgi:hypothetical protein